MPATLTMLGLYKSAQIALPLLRAGGSMLRSAMTSGSEAGEWEKGVQEILGDQVKELLKGKIDKLSSKKLEAVEAPLVAFTALVLQSLVEDVLATEDFTSVKAEFTVALPELPQRWKAFVAQGVPGSQPLTGKDFLAALQAAHEGDDTSPIIQSEWLTAFFSQWIQRDIGLTRQREGWHQKLADAVAPLVADAVSSTLAAEHPVAATAFRESMLRFHTELRQKLQQIDTRTTEIAKTQKKESGKATKRHKQVKSVLGEVKAMLKTQTAADRIKKYREALLTAFRPYQELGIDDYERGEKETSDIRDIFVHPACSKEHLWPEDMDEAQRETPPRLPAQDLLPLLAQDDHRRTVLLADPGMGKSTLIQSLIAHLASGRSLSGAPTLTDLLPVPLILRDLVPLLPQDQVETWTWNGLLAVLIEHYQRDETAPSLCDGFKDHRDEFRLHLHTDAKVFFLIDGLDEIGDLAKRRQIVQCIQDGIRAAHKDARWLITSRVIGYLDARLDWVEAPDKQKWASAAPNGVIKKSKWVQLKPSSTTWASAWHDYVLKFSDTQSLAEVSEFIVDDSAQEAAQLLSPEDRSLLNKGRIRHRVLSALPIAQRLHLAPFDDKRQDLFTQRWFQHRHSTDYSRELMREVRAHHHDGVRIISRVPNLLCMMNILKRSGKPLPDGRAALYDAIVQAYLGGIDSAYRLRPILGNTCPFDTPQRRFLLSLLGAHMQQSRTMQASGDEGRAAAPQPPHIALGQSAVSHAEGNILISRPELEKLLSPAIQRMRDEHRIISEHTTAELLDELLHHIASRSGLLIPRSSDADGNTFYGFTHLSFLEFFAAEWLGMEFDRQRNRNSRRTEAADDGQSITEAELESEFPPLGPIQHARDSFKDQPAVPARHEPLIFLLETRKADTSTLLRWLFPALHSSKPHLVSKDDPNPTPLLPLDAVQLATKLAQDPEVPLPVDTRQQWWRILWAAYLAWPHEPWEEEKSKAWHIPPSLLSSSSHRKEVIRALVEVYPKEWGHPAPTSPPLYLTDCPQLTSADLAGLSVLAPLENLCLSGCTGLERLPDLSALHRLRNLSLSGCTNLRGLEALSSLAMLTSLETLHLSACPQLERLPDLRALKRLRWLSMNGCIGLSGPKALSSLAELTSLERLYLSHCTGLKRLPDLRGLQCLHSLDLSGCHSLHGPEALRGLSELASLKTLVLISCNGLERLPNFRSLQALETLLLVDCTSLHGPEALRGLSELNSLETLNVTGCTGLTKDDVDALREKLGKKCEIYGP